MPQFDLNILNSQNVNIFSFFFSYMFYVKSLYFFLLYYFKLPYKVLVSFFLYFLKEILYIKSSFSNFFLKLLFFLKQYKIIVYSFYCENKFVFFL